MAIFNLVPAFPLDGGRIFRSALWAYRKDLLWATLIASRSGSMFGIFLIVFGILYIITGMTLSGIWLMLIGIFINQIAKMSYRQTLIQEVLKDEPIRKFVQKDPITVSPDLSLKNLVEDYMYHDHHDFYPVVKDKRLLGCVGVWEFHQHPKEKWIELKVADVMTPYNSETAVPADLEVTEILKKIQITGRTHFLVTEDDQLIGVITLKDLTGLISLRLELERE